MLVQRYPLLGGTSLGGCQADCKDGVGTQLTLVVGAVQLDHGSVDCGLVRWVCALCQEWCRAQLR